MFFMFGLWVVVARGVVVAYAPAVQTRTRKSSRGPILNIEMEGDCDGSDQEHDCSVDTFRPARWRRILSINSPRKRMLGTMTNEHKNKTEWKRDGESKTCMSTMERQENTTGNYMRWLHMINKHIRMA